MAKCKKYENGGLTFADMDKEDRDAAAAAAIADLDARQAARSAEAGGLSEIKTTPRRRTTGYDATEAKRNLARAGSEHASGKKSKGAVGDLIDIFRRGGKYLMKEGGAVKSPSKSKASSSKARGCGCAQRGLTKGKMR